MTRLTTKPLAPTTQNFASCAQLCRCRRACRARCLNEGASSVAGCCSMAHARLAQAAEAKPRRPCGRTLSARAANTCEATPEVGGETGSPRYGIGLGVESESPAGQGLRLPGLPTPLVHSLYRTGRPNGLPPKG